MIVNFFDLTDSFTLPPEESIEFFQNKGLRPTFSYLDMVAEEHDAAFTVAKMMDNDLLATTRDAVDSALADGKTLAQFKEELVPTLQKAGWWGAQPITDPATGQTTVGQLGSTSRLETIFRTNLQSAYSVGHWGKIIEQADEAPYLMYDAVDDHRTRAEHAAWDGTVLEVNDPFWRAWMPPNGFNCRCGVIQMDSKELGQYGLTPSASPQLNQAPWTNPRTGQTRMVPQGLDPQFTHNPGMARTKKLQQLAQEKNSILAPPEQQAIDLSSAAIQKAREASKTALINSPAMKKIQEIDAKATAQAKAAKEIQEAAQAEINAAVANKTPYLHAAIKQVSNKKTAKDMTPAQLLEEAKGKAEATKQSALVANYKQQKLKGKTPNASQQQAYDNLPETQKQAIAQEIEVKDGNYQAKTQVEEYKTSPGFSAEKKAIKKLENQGELQGLEPKQQLAKINQAAAAQKAAEQQAKAVKAYKANLAKGKKPTENQAAAFKALPESQQESLLNEIDTTKSNNAAQAKLDEFAQAAEGKPVGHPAVAAHKAAQQTNGPPTTKAAAAEKAAQEAQETAAQPQTATPAQGKVTPPNPDRLVKTGPQEGTNYGGWYLDQDTDVEWYIKIPENADQARNEVLAGKLYREAGVETPHLEMTTLEGRTAIASRRMDGLEQSGEKLRAGKISNVKEQYGVDAWLANWDVVGLQYDNLKIRGTTAVRVDPGGALRYRAQGGQKGTAFGDTVSEIETLRDPNMNPQAASVFKDVTDEHIRESVARIAAIDDEVIRELVQQYGPDSIKEQGILFNRLKARRDDLVRRFPPKQPKAVPQPQRATVTAGQVQEIENAGITGHTVRTDLGDIEDHNVRFTRQIDVNGNPVTRVTIQLTEQGKHKVNAKLSGGAVSGPVANATENLRDSISELLAGLNMQHKGSAGLRDKDVNRYNQVKLDAGDAIEDLTQIGTPQAQQTIRDIEEIQGLIEKAYLKTKAKNPDPLPNVPFNKIAVADDNVAPFKMTKKGASLEYPQVKVGPDGAKQTGHRFTMNAGPADHRDYNLGDGATMRLYDDQKNWTMDGHMDIEIPGGDARSATRAMEALEEMGIDTTPASPEARRSLMLDQTAFRRYKGRNEARLEKYSKMKTIDEKADFISADAGFDIRTRPDWSDFDHASAFGNGRQSLYRTDIDTPEFREWSKENLLYHNPTGLAKNSKANIEGDLSNLLSGGGTLTSLRDRVRRGLPESKNAEIDDFQGGGGASVFTRVTPINHKATGYYWKPERQMRRADRMTYRADNYGDRRRNHEKHLDTVEEFGDLAGEHGGDETFFKDGLSIFEDLSHIQTASATERKSVLALFRSYGYDEWPDGRKLESVIL